MNLNPSETVLITGASSGIGFELAKLFARDGYGLVLNARDPERLNQAAKQIESRSGGPVLTAACDLSRPGGPLEISRILKEKKIEPDILINNAGYGIYGSFEKTDPARELEMIQLNILSLTHLTKLFLPAMLRKGRGKILNVASTAAFQPGPLMAVYYATKAYVYSFTRALKRELTGRGITVSVLCPGPTRSNFQDTAGIDKRIKLFQTTLMTPAQVAAIAYRKFKNGREVIIPGLVNQIFALGSWLMPEGLVIEAVHFLQKSKARDV